MSTYVSFRRQARRSPRGPADSRLVSSPQGPADSRLVSSLVSGIRANGADQATLELLKRELRPFVICKCAEAMAEYLKCFSDKGLVAEGVYRYQIDERVERIAKAFLDNHITLEKNPDIWLKPYLARYIDEVAPKDGAPTFVEFIEGELSWNVALYEPEATKLVLGIQGTPDEEKAAKLRKSLADFLMPFLFDCVARSVRNYMKESQSANEGDIADIAQTIAVERILKPGDETPKSNVYRYCPGISKEVPPEKDCFTGHLQSVLMKRTDRGRCTNIVANLSDKLHGVHRDPGAGAIDFEAEPHPMEEAGSDAADAGESAGAKTRRIADAELAEALAHSRNESLQRYCLVIASLIEPHLLEFCNNVDGLDTAKHGWTIDERYILTYRIWLLVAGVFDAQRLFDDEADNPTKKRFKKLIRRGDENAGNKPYASYAKGALACELAAEYRIAFYSKVDFTTVLAKRIADAHVEGEFYLPQEVIDDSSMLPYTVMEPLGRVIHDEKTKKWHAALLESIADISTFIDTYEKGGFVES